MKPGDVIARKYRVLEPVAGAGKSEAFKVSRGGDILFLKRFTSPLYPKFSSGYTAAELKKRQLSAEAFEQRHTTIMTLLGEPIVGGGNLVKPVDFFREGASYFKAYPFVQAANCKTLIRQRSDKKLIFVKTFLLCLRELHVKGIVHSDIKPDNVLIESKPAGMVAKLIDFDEAYLSGSPPRRVGGDPVYYSPELNEHVESGGRSETELTTKSDIFSAGLLIQLIAAKQFPNVEGGTGESPAERVSTGGIVQPARLMAPFPDAFSDAVADTLQRSPDRRPTVEGLLDALGVELPGGKGTSGSGGGGSGRPPPPPPPAGTPEVTVKSSMGRRGARTT